MEQPEAKTNIGRNYKEKHIRVQAIQDVAKTNWNGK